MTTANKITVLRILLVPLFAAQVLDYLASGNEIHRLAAMLAFGLAAVGDGIDGYIARRYNQQSDLGAILDPLADKLLLATGIVLFTLKNEPHFERIPIWLSVMIIGGGALQLIGLLFVQTNCTKVIVRPRLVGKLATVFQIVLLSWILLKWHSGWLPVWIYGAAIFTGVSFLFYTADGLRQLSASPRSAAVQ
jgi:cardiolipin synthase